MHKNFGFDFNKNLNNILPHYLHCKSFERYFLNKKHIISQHYLPVSIFHKSKATYKYSERLCRPLSYCDCRDMKGIVTQNLKKTFILVAGPYLEMMPQFSCKDKSTFKVNSKPREQNIVNWWRAVVFLVTLNVSSCFGLWTHIFWSVIFLKME